MSKHSCAPREHSVSPLEIARFRLARHHLLEATPSGAVAVARDVCGMQAQVMSAAFLQLWARNHAITRAEIESALWQKRSLVKTSLMRQTLHIVPADAFPTYIAALRTSRIAAALRIMARFKISSAEAADLTGLIMDSLCSGPLSRAAIRAAVHPKVSKRVRAWMAKVWSIVRLLIAEGLICYGSGEDNEVTFIRTDQWLGKQRSVPEEEAREDLLRGYLRAYGPATLTDFSHWSGMPAAEVRPLRALLGEQLAEIKVENKPYLLLRDDVHSLHAAYEGKQSVRLLPHFDPYLLAHREKDHLLDPEHYKRVYRNQGWISPVLLVDGRIAGTWSYQLQGKTLRMTIQPFSKLSRAIRTAIAREGDMLSRFLGRKLELSV
jgi:hypothetical protein